MKRRVHCYLLSALLFYPFLAAAGSEEPAAVEFWGKKMESIVIPKIELREASLEQSIAFLAKEALANDPQKVGVPIRVRGIQPSKPQGSTGSNAEPDLVSFPVGISASVEPENRLHVPRISLSLTDVPLVEVLRYVAGQDGRKLRIEADGVYLVLQNEPDAIYEQTFATNAKINRLLKIKREGSQIRESLEALGVTSPEDSATILSEDQNTLTVRNTSENLDRIEELLKDARDQIARDDDPNFPPPPTGPARELAEEGLLEMKLHAEQIIIPIVEIRGVPLGKAIDQLKRLCRDADTAEPDPDKRGINMVLSAPGNETALNAEREAKSPTVYAKTIVHCVGRNMPCIKVLQSLASQANMRVELAPYCVQFVPEDTPERLVAKEYVLPNRFFENLASPKLAEELSQRFGYGRRSSAASDFVNNLGKQEAPEGSSANWLSEQNKLVVRNTRKIHESLQAVVDKAWEDEMARRKALKESLQQKTH